MSKLSDSDLDLLDSALLDAMEYMRQQDDNQEAQDKKESYKKLYNRLFLSDKKVEVKIKCYHLSGFTITS